MSSARLCWHSIFRSAAEGWALFLISSLSWTLAGAVMKDMSLVVLQFAFVVVDMIGVWRWLIV